MAMTVLCVMLGWAVSTFAYWLTLVFALMAVGFIGMFAWEAIPRRSRYSLASLREFEDKEEIRKLYEGLEKVPSDADTAVCAGCLEPYPSELRRCPYCKCCR